jgi:hypothetical protein
MPSINAIYQCRPLMPSINAVHECRQLMPSINAIHTLASRGLEELFFQLWFCVSFWFWRETGFGFTYLCT